MLRHIGGIALGKGVAVPYAFHMTASFWIGNQPLILASQSASRQQLLNLAGVPFVAQPAHLDESVIKQDYQVRQQTADQAAAALAVAKASAISAEQPDSYVLGADQLLTCDGVWYDKPVDLADARQHLQDFRGKTVELPTAVALVQNGQVLWQTVVTPRLVMREYSEAFLAVYMAEAGDSILKAVGALQIEKLGQQLIERVEGGDQATIMGLPMAVLLAQFRQMGLLLS